MTSIGDKDQYGLSYRLHYRESCAPTCAERNFWLFSAAWLFRLPGWFLYPLVFIHLYMKKSPDGIEIPSEKIPQLFSTGRSVCSMHNLAQLLVINRFPCVCIFTASPRPCIVLFYESNEKGALWASIIRSTMSQEKSTIAENFRKFNS